jgi:4-cresol dehydrogenase (hydroxylating)
MAMNIESAISDWRNLLGDTQILAADIAQAVYGSDTGGVKRRIPAALKILDGDLLPEVMRVACRYGVAVHPISTGHNWGYGSSLPVQDDCVIIDLSGMCKIRHFDVEFGVVTVEPGVTQAMLADFLDAGAHPFMVPVTGAGPHCSLIGNALERGYGITPHTDHFAAVTDMEAVLADGSLYRTAMHEAGGEDLARLFKWGIGAYTAGLFTQSGLGIVTRMSIVLARRPESVKVCLFSLKNDQLLEVAVERIRTILGRLAGVVGGINLMNQRRMLAMSAPFPTDRIGVDGLIPEVVLAELGQQYHILPWTGFATLYGTDRIMAAVQKEIRAALAGVASRLIFLSPARASQIAFLARLLPGGFGDKLARTADMIAKALQLAAGRPNETALPLCYWRNPRPPSGSWLNPARDGCGLIWYAPLVPMRSQGVRAYVEMVRKITIKHGIEPLITLTSINDKIFDSTVPLIFDRENPVAQTAANVCYGELLEAGRLLGNFPYRVGINNMETLAALQNDARKFHSRIRNALDPARILAPERYE